MKSFYVRTKRRYVQIHINQILYAIADGHHTKIVTDYGEFLPFLDLGKLEAKLPKERFFRINRSTIVNMEKIIAFDPEQVLLKGISFSFGDQYYRTFKDRIVLLQQDDG